MKKASGISWLVVVSTCVNLSFPPILLAGEVTDSLSLPKELLGRARGNEFVSGDTPGAVLMKVNLWGAVNRPGIHYVPLRTDLVTLLSYAGGPMPNAEMDQMLIKRRAK